MLTFVLVFDRLVHIRTSRKQLRSWLTDGVSTCEAAPLQVFRHSRRHQFLHAAYAAPRNVSSSAVAAKRHTEFCFGECAIQPHEIVSLGLSAFHEVFSRHKPLYGRAMLLALQRQIHTSARSLERRLGSTDLSSSNDLLHSIDWK